ncbi:MAG: deoxyribodipyrimidine photolyase [Acidobacteria bacterium]|nr:deoxyribodipyrimidine photolyase [Acidobacteriota bacterium]
MDRSSLPPARLRVANDRPVRAEGSHVLYWMTSARRLGWNFGLERSIEWAEALGLPLRILEAVRSDHRWASARFHAFLVAGMAENRALARELPVGYHPYVEPAPRAGSGLVERLAAEAAVVVTDEFPGFFLPRMLAAVAARLPVALEAVDSNGLLPLAATEAEHPTAHAFRRVLQRTLPRHLDWRPAPDPFAGRKLRRPPPLAAEIRERWPEASEALLAGERGALAELPIDAEVAPVDGTRGGTAAARRRLEAFLDRRLARYAEERNQPELEVASGLSPYLHFGHLSVHEVLTRLAEREGWSPEDVAPGASGARAGWWGMSAPAEAFLDELVTWREVGYHFAHHRPDDYDRYESLPAWALATLGRHERDRRDPVYTHEQLESAETHDPLWNAAQRQLRREGAIHNYLRMLWGKKVLEWSPDPRSALERLVELNNRWALDGRDPNSYSGIFWCLGRFDRAWGPERPIFGTVRYMSSENTARKLRVRGYLERYGPESARGG